MNKGILSLKSKATILAVLLFFYTTCLGFYKPIPAYAVDPVTITLTIDEFLSIAFELGWPMSDLNSLIYYFGTNGVNVEIPPGGTVKDGVANILNAIKNTPKSGLLKGGIKGGLYVILIIELIMLAYEGYQLYQAVQDYNAAYQQALALGMTPEQIAQQEAQAAAAIGQAGYVNVADGPKMNDYCYFWCEACSGNIPSNQTVFNGTIDCGFSWINPYGWIACRCP